MFLILLQRYTFYLNRAIYRGIFLRKVLLERVGALTGLFFPVFAITAITGFRNVLNTCGLHRII